MKQLKLFEDQNTSENQQENEVFDWAKEFPKCCDENGNFEGFDVVIGNPPYYDYRQMDKKIAEHWKNSRTNYKSQRANIYQYFIEQAYNILKENGLLCYINPNQFLSIDAGYGTRKFLLENTNVLFIKDVSYIKIFNKAATYTVVWGFQKEKPDHTKILYGKCNDVENLYGFQSSIDVNEILKSKKLMMIEKSNHQVINKIEKGTTQLGNLCELAWGTSKSGYGKLKILHADYQKLSKSKKAKYQPILQTRDIKNYYIDWKKEYIPKEIYSKNITKKFQVTEKLLVARMTLQLQAAIDYKQAFVGKSTLITHINPQIDIKYLLALLNSKLVDYWYKTYFENTHMSGGYIRFDIPYLKQIPVKVVPKTDQTPIIKLVDKILKQKEKKPDSDTSKLEKQIDKAVYKLYGLTKEEIKVVENEAT